MFEVVDICKATLNKMLREKRVAPMKVVGRQMDPSEAPFANIRPCAHMTFAYISWLQNGFVEQIKDWYLEPTRPGAREISEIDDIRIEIPRTLFHVFW